jgi:hypothetical protein
MRVELGESAATMTAAVLAKTSGRSLDRLLLLGTGELRGQEVAVVEGFGQAVEERAIAQKVAAHRQDDVCGLLGCSGGGQQ